MGCSVQSVFVLRIGFDAQLGLPNGMVILSSLSSRTRSGIQSEQQVHEMAWVQTGSRVFARDDMIRSRVFARFEKEGLF